MHRDVVLNPLSKTLVEMYQLLMNEHRNQVMRYRSLTFTLVTSLAIALASCSKEEAPEVTQATAKPESTPAPAAPAKDPAPESVTAVELAKEETSKPTAPKVGLEAVTPSTTAADLSVEAEKAKLQAEQAKL
jgi:hypothetical protein